MPRFCSQCGHKNADDAGFCESCGTPMVPAERFAPTHLSPAVSSSPEPNRRRWPLYLAGIAVAAIVGALVSAFALPSGPVTKFMANVGIRLPSSGGWGETRYRLYPVYQSGKWGFVDRTGKLVIPIQFEDVLGQEHEIGRAHV